MDLRLARWLGALALLLACAAACAGPARDPDSARRSAPPVDAGPAAPDAAPAAAVVPPPPRWLGALLTATAGFTSFIAHAGGPPLNAYLIPLKLKPVVFTATMSVFFFAINLSKWVPYAWLGLLDLRNMATSLALLPFAPPRARGSSPPSIAG